MESIIKPYAFRVDQVAPRAHTMEEFLPISTLHLSLRDSWRVIALVT
jgi:hypothetical protein